MTRSDAPCGVMILQLGHGNGDDVLSPKVIESLGHVRVVQVSCGATSSAAVTDTGEYWTTCSETMTESET